MDSVLSSDKWENFQFEISRPAIFYLYKRDFLVTRILLNFLRSARTCKNAFRTPLQYTACIRGNYQFEISEA
jgi:hypothetical protein